MTIESEFTKVITLKDGRMAIELYVCRTCHCMVTKPDRRSHREAMHPPRVHIENTGPSISIEEFFRGRTTSETPTEVRGE